MKRFILRKKYIIIILTIFIGIIFAPKLLASSIFYDSYLALGDSIAEGYGLTNKTIESYASKVKAKYNISSTKYNNKAVVGMTCKGFYTHIKGSEVTNLIKNAELISISIGSNELLSIVLEHMSGDSYWELAGQALTLYDFLTSEETEKKVEAAIATYKTNWIASIDYIKSINPNADIIATEFYHPYYGVKLLTYDYGTVIGKHIDKMNDILWEESKNQTRYKIAKIHDDFNVTSPRLTNVNIAVTNFNVDPHPTAEGHNKIYTRIVEALVKDINKVTFETIPNQNYTGSALKPTVVLKNRNRPLTLGEDYTVSYSNNIQPGKATITITGKGNYKGTTTKTFNIIKDISNFTVVYDKTLVYSGAAQQPSITLKDGSKELTKGTDYTVTYKNNTHAGQGEFTITGKGYYKGTITKSFIIEPKEITDLTYKYEGEVEYSGMAITPVVIIKYGAIQLLKNTHYTITYINNTNVGQASFVVIGNGDYTGTVTKTFAISPKSVSNLQVTYSDSYIYTGSAITPIPTVKNGSKELVKDTDYIVTYKNNTNAGQGEFIITGKGNYTGTVTKTFTINPKPVSNLQVTYSDSYIYTGSAITPIPTAKNGSKELVKDTDYTVTYKNNTNAGQGEFIITGKGNYTGTVTKTFTIQPKSIDLLKITYRTGMTYTGEELFPIVIVKDGNNKLVNDTDYVLSFKNNVNVGQAQLTITGKGNYAGTVTKTFIVEPKDVAKITTYNYDSSAEYSGEPIMANITITYGSKKLVKGTDYAVTYKNNTNVGQGEIIVTGKGNYTGTITKSFSITPKNVSNLEITYDNVFEYTGNEITPAVILKNGSKALVKDTDYTITYKNNINAGKGELTITGKGNYTGTVTKIFTIQAKDVNKLTYQYNLVAEYLGTPITPAITIKNESKELVKDTDYIVTYKNNTNAGKGEIIVTGKGNYTGKVTKNFTIQPKSLVNLDVSDIIDYTYTGKTIVQKLTIKDGSKEIVKDKDYIITYKNNIKVGQSEIIVTGIGNYAGTVTKTFLIHPKDITEFATEFEREHIYTGTVIKPNITVIDGKTKLNYKTDYTVTYSKNYNVGEIAMVVTGTGNYTGAINETFNIVHKNINDIKIGEILPQPYSGSQIEPAIVLDEVLPDFKADIGYTAEYIDNIEIGEATIILKGTGNYTGERELKFEIIKKNIADTVIDKIPKQKFTGFKIEPSINIINGSWKLEQDKDYEIVEYRNNIQKGTATVKIRGIGNYEGEVEQQFKIVSIVLTSRHIIIIILTVLVTIGLITIIVLSRHARRIDSVKAKGKISDKTKDSDKNKTRDSEKIKIK